MSFAEAGCKDPRNKPGDLHFRKLDGISIRLPYLRQDFIIPGQLGQNPPPERAASLRLGIVMHILAVLATELLVAPPIFDLVAAMKTF